MKTILFCLFSTTITGISHALEADKNINHSSIAFTVNDKELLPENIAFDQRTQTFYLGSTRRSHVLKRTNGTDWSVFISGKELGIDMILGMKVDTGRRHLWLVSSYGPNLVTPKPRFNKKYNATGIYKFDIDTGALLDKYQLDVPGEFHFFNDLLINDNGDVYITHTMKSFALYKIDVDTNQLKKLLDLSDYPYPNGITTSGDKRHLFVSYSGGIIRISLTDLNIRPLSLTTPVNISGSKSIDGLYWYKNALIAVQPENRSVQLLHLNDEQDQIINTKMLELNHPMMNNPSTGVVVGDQFYYIANAQFENFDADGQLFDHEQLYEPVVLQTNLHFQEKP